MNKKVSKGIETKVGRDLLDILFWIYEDMKFDKDVLFRLTKKMDNNKELQEIIISRENENREDIAFLLHVISPVNICIKIKTGENKSLIIDEFV